MPSSADQLLNIIFFQKGDHFAFKNFLDYDFPRFFFFLRLNYFGRWAKWLNRLIIHLQAPTSYIGTRFSPSYTTSVPAPCALPGNAAEDGQKPWDPEPTWEAWRRLLAPNWLSSGHYSPLGSKQSGWRMFLFVYLTDSILKLSQQLWPCQVKDKIQELLPGPPLG